MAVDSISMFSHRGQVLGFRGRQSGENEKKLTEQFKQTGRIRIEAWPGEGSAWLVESYDKADDIREGSVYSRDMWPDFVKLAPEHKLQIREFLCGLGGGRFDGLNQDQEPGS
jgi:hypothetical protein